MENKIGYLNNQNGNLRESVTKEKSLKADPSLEISLVSENLKLKEELELARNELAAFKISLSDRKKLDDDSVIRTAIPK